MVKIFVFNEMLFLVEKIVNLARALNNNLSRLVRQLLNQSESLI